MIMSWTFVSVVTPSHSILLRLSLESSIEEVALNLKSESQPVICAYLLTGGSELWVWRQKVRLHGEEVLIR